MDLKKLYATDEARETDGVWFELGEGARVKVARMENPRYEAARQRKTKKYGQGGFRAVKIPDAVWEGIFDELVAEAILLDWEGIEEDGQPLPPTPENRLKVIRAYKDFRQMIVGFSNQMEAYRAEEVEGAGKNFSPSSPGSSAGEKSAVS